MEGSLVHILNHAFSADQNNHSQLLRTLGKITFRAHKPNDQSNQPLWFNFLHQYTCSKTGHQINLMSCELDIEGNFEFPRLCSHHSTLSLVVCARACKNSNWKQLIGSHKLNFLLWIFIRIVELAFVNKDCRVDAVQSCAGNLQIYGIYSKPYTAFTPLPYLIPPSLVQYPPMSTPSKVSI